MQSQLVEIIKTSDSNKILHQLNSKFTKHFHEHSHVLYDIRTLLGPRESPVVYLEIGSYIGSSAALMLQHPYATDIICVDPLNLPATHYKGTTSQEDTLRQNIKKHNINNYPVTIHKRFSTDQTLLAQLTANKTSIDILFIDGDHRYKGVIDDWKNFEPMVKPGGFIVFNNYLDKESSPQVRRAVDDIVAKLDRSKYEIIGSLPNYQNAFSAIPKTFSNEFIIYKGALVTPFITPSVYIHEGHYINTI